MQLPESKRHPSELMFELFKDMDTNKTRLHNLVEVLRERRDFSARGIQRMMKMSKVRHDGLG